MIFREWYDWLYENFPNCLIEMNKNGFKITIKQDENVIVGSGETLKDAIRDVMKLANIVGIWHI